VDQRKPMRSWFRKENASEILACAFIAWKIVVYAWTASEILKSLCLSLP